MACPPIRCSSLETRRAAPSQRACVCIRGWRTIDATLTSSSEHVGSSTSNTSSTRPRGNSWGGSRPCPLTFVLEEAVDALSSIHSRHLACANTTSNTSNTSSSDAKCVTTSARQMPVHSNTALCMVVCRLCIHARTPPLPVRRTTAGAVFRTSHVL